MKLLHCADLHIGSKLLRVANSKMRRQELIQSFKSMVEFAVNSNCEAIIIAGDVIDSDTVSRSELADVASIINKYTNINYYMLKGNHGSSRQYDKLLSLCGDNVFVFGEEWTSYKHGNCTIAGIELSRDSDSSIYDSLCMPENTYNIVVMHGDVDSNDYGDVNINALKDKCNYVALGHKHGYQVVGNGKNFVALYSGVLECRGFDEVSGSGFVVIDSDKGSYQYVKQAIRAICDVTVDCSDITSNSQLSDVVLAQTADFGNKNYLHLHLTGSLSVDISVDSLEESLAGRFFALRVDNCTKTKIDLESIANEDSLRGEVVRLIKGQDDEDELIRLSLLALAGEEVQW